MKKRFLKAILITLSVCILLGASVIVQADETDLQKDTAEWVNLIKGEKGIEEYEQNFDSLTVDGSFIDEDALTEHWETARGNSGDPNHDGLIKKKDDKTYLSLGPFTQMVSAFELQNKYIFELDYKSDNNQFAGIFFRTTGEAFNTTATVNFYEADGSKFGNEGIGSTGMYLMPRATKLLLFIKTYDSELPTFLNNVKIELQTNVDFSQDFHRISITDDASVAKIYVDGAFIASIEYSNKTILDDALSEYSSYSKAVVKDKEGTVLKEVENALICADFSKVAVAIRINQCFIDNIRIVEYPKDVKPIDTLTLKTAPIKTEFVINSKFDKAGAKLTAKYTDGTTEDIDVTDDMISGYDMTKLGEQTVKIQYGDKSVEYKINVVEEIKPTQAPSPSPVKTAAPTAKAESKTEGGNTGSIIGICAAACAIVVIVIIIVVKKKKK